MQAQVQLAPAHKYETEHGRRAHQQQLQLTERII